jgi:hypothetical protein
MATNSTLPPLLNPNTPYAYLPPDLANKYEASIYLGVGTLFVCIPSLRDGMDEANSSTQAFSWDWLTSIFEEVRICKRKLRPSIFAYFFSR